MIKEYSNEDKKTLPGGEEITSELSADDTPTVSITDIIKSKDAESVITIDKADDEETVSIDQSIDNIIDVSSSSFDVSASVDSNTDTEAAESIITQPDEVDATYTIINDNEYVQPEAPAQPMSIDTPEGYIPAPVEPMVYSTAEATAPEESSKLPIILLVSILLGIVLVGGIIYNLIK